LRLLDVDFPSQLKGRDPYEMYVTLCQKTKQRQDPCVLDVFISVTRFMSGEPAKEWWAFTEERKKTLSKSSRDHFADAPR
jgi:Pathogenicity locus